MANGETDDDELCDVNEDMIETSLDISSKETNFTTGLGIL